MTSHQQAEAQEQPDARAPVAQPVPGAGPYDSAPEMKLPPLTEAEITVAPTDYDAAADCITRAGVVILRGAIGRGVVAEVLAAARRAFERLPQVAPADDVAAQSLMRLSMIGPGLTRGFDELMTLARQVVENGPGRPILERYLDGPLIHDPATLRFRSHRPSQTLSHVPMHQDVAFTSLDRNWINFWVPLTPCGEVAPGLEFFPLRKAAFFPHAEEVAPGGYPMGFISEEALGRYPFPLQALEPVFEPGDLLMFDGFCPHRTVERPGMTQTRMSFEFRYSAENSKGPGTDGPRPRLRAQARQ